MTALKRTRVALIVSLSALVASCGSSASPTELSSPGVSGSWGSSWRWTETTLYTQGGAGDTRETRCTATLTITSQNATTFQGRYTIDCAAAHYAGAVDGRLSLNTQMSFRLVPETGGDPVLPASWSYPTCQIADPQTYEGTLSGDTINVSRNLTIDCPPGRILVSSGFAGTRRP
jgi:hypothetical protein